MNPVRQVAAAGRYGDTTLLHVSPDEIRSLSQLGPITTNPVTGLPEAGLLGDILKGIGSLAATIGGTALGGPLGGALASGLFSGITSKNLKKGLLAGMLSYAGGAAMDKFAQAGAAKDALSAADLAKTTARTGGKMVPGAGDLIQGQVMTQVNPSRNPLKYLSQMTGGMRDLGVRGSADLAMKELGSAGKMALLYPQIGNVAASIKQDEAAEMGYYDPYNDELRRSREQYNRRYGNNPWASLYTYRRGYAGGGYIPPDEDGGIMSIAPEYQAYLANVPLPSSGISAFPLAFSGDWGGDYSPTYYPNDPNDPGQDRDDQNVPPDDQYPGSNPPYSPLPPPDTGPWPTPDPNDNSLIPWKVRTPRAIDPGFIPGYHAEYEYFGDENSPDGFVRGREEGIDPFTANRLLAELIGTPQGFAAGGIVGNGFMPPVSMGQPPVSAGRPTAMPPVSMGQPPAMPPVSMGQPSMRPTVPASPMPAPRMPMRTPTMPTLPQQSRFGAPMGMPWRDSGAFGGRGLGRRNFAGGGMVGGGMDDDIPAVVTGTGQQIAVSPGEYVIPADVVSMLGDGDSNSGADALKEMVYRVRMEKTGSPLQMPPITSNVMPK